MSTFRILYFVRAHAECIRTVLLWSVNVIFGAFVSAWVGMWMRLRAILICSRKRLSSSSLLSMTIWRCPQTAARGLRPTWMIPLNVRVTSTKHIVLIYSNCFGNSCDCPKCLAPCSLTMLYAVLCVCSLCSSIWVGKWCFLNCLIFERSYSLFCKWQNERKWPLRVLDVRQRRDAIRAEWTVSDGRRLFEVKVRVAWSLELNRNLLVVRTWLLFLSFSQNQIVV